MISGLAWSGRGKIARVDVSLDGGRNWREAKIDGLVLDKAVRALLRRDRMDRRGAAAAIARDRRDRLRAADQGRAAQDARRQLDLSQQRHPDLAGEGATARSRMSKCLNSDPHPEERRRRRRVSKDGQQAVLAAILRDAPLRGAPQDEVR